MTGVKRLDDVIQGVIGVSLAGFAGQRLTADAIKPGIAAHDHGLRIQAGAEAVLRRLQLGSCRPAVLHRRERQPGEILVDGRRVRTQELDEGRLLGVAQALLKRAEQRHGRDNQGGDRGDEHHADDPTTQTEGMSADPGHG